MDRYLAGGGAGLTGTPSRTARRTVTTDARLWRGGSNRWRWGGRDPVAGTPTRPGSAGTGRSGAESSRRHHSGPPSGCLACTGCSPRLRASRRRWKSPLSNRLRPLPLSGRYVGGRGCSWSSCRNASAVIPTTTAGSRWSCRSASTTLVVGRACRAVRWPRRRRRRDGRWMSWPRWRGGPGRVTRSPAPVGRCESVTYEQLTRSCCKRRYVAAARRGAVSAWPPGGGRPPPRPLETTARSAQHGRHADALGWSASGWPTIHGLGQHPRQPPAGVGGHRGESSTRFGGDTSVASLTRTADTTRRYAAPAPGQPIDGYKLLQRGPEAWRPATRPAGRCCDSSPCRPSRSWRAGRRVAPRWACVRSNRCPTPAQPRAEPGEGKRER
jgi:hypothetical protein